MGQVVYLAEAATATGAQNAELAPKQANAVNGAKTFQASGTTTAGAGAVAVDIEVSNDGIGWILLGTISLTLSTTVDSDGFTSSAPWARYRANVTSISGTGASVSVTMGS